MKHSYEDTLKSLEQPMLDTLKEWIAIPSVKQDPLPGAPFGQPVKDMLDKAVKDCQAMGFDTQAFDGYAGHAELGQGSDEDALAILVHLDVVPVGDGWTRPPFEATQEGNLLYGRGTSDDKGPAVAALYAMKAVKDLGLPLKRKVRLILGCDEESGWDDIAHYKKVATMPRMGFSPDGSYPLINIEKGMAGLELTADLSKDGLQVKRFMTGERTNVIPGAAEALVYGDDGTVARVNALAKAKGWQLSAELAEPGTVKIKAKGIPGHSAYPEGTLNAIGMMLVVLKELGATGPLAELADKVGIDHTGKHLGIACRDELSGPLTMNMGIIKVENGKLFATLDIRHPILIAGDRLQGVAQNHITGVTVSQVSLKMPHYVPAQSELVQQLLASYTGVTGREGAPKSTGGGTYARSLKEGVAFGAAFPEDPDVAHQADEYIFIDKLFITLRIMTEAIIRLAGA